MAFIKNNSRKTMMPSFLNEDNLVNINMRDHTIVDNGKIANFERLLYRGCPILPLDGYRVAIPINQPDIVDANRRSLVVSIFNILCYLDATNRTKINIFNELVRFIRMSEAQGFEEIFCIGSILFYSKSLVDHYNKGVKGKTLLSRQNSIKVLLRQLDPDLFNKCNDYFIKFPHDTKSAEPYTDDEIKELIPALSFIFNDYCKHIESGTIPKIFPLYDIDDSNGEQRYENVNLSERTVSYYSHDMVWVSDLVRVAYYLTCFYTGANATSLLKMKKSDLSDELFTDITRKIYKLKIKKGRQNGRVNEINVGFTREAKIFFERWIRIIDVIDPYEDGFLFPNPSDGKKSYMTDSSARILSNLFTDLGLPILSSQRFRKTKASLIMRATESVFFVSQGLNNTVETSAKYYADGNPTTVEFSLASALYIREQSALGKPLDKVIEDSKFIYKDPLKESEVSQKFKKLTNGLRCGGSFKHKSKNLKSDLIKNGLANDSDIVACHKFLECFGCKHHAVVAEVDDVWLLLSFNDIILESITRPAINSHPSYLLSKVSNTVQLIIDRMKKDHTIIYNKAYNKYLDSVHPLWDSVDDLELMLGIY
ncbi:MULTISPECIES: hypothetical protein [unclassified Tatumella]|uniref:hypothetical protein n=1 Tax=unclassified Tatumella TaxID=2649542 RepID=UPI001BAFB164|nr:MULTISPECIES: hypothetical protein [unclassified Tatumella]MBS0855341.1 hypothetical protein [Tatumella sp. JGM16]MBS0894110.1 hypothetical protein [Tatumella sp. JGM130]MBS0911575.1 hypothetical protein [Tatumella sp. JGM91]